MCRLKKNNLKNKNNFFKQVKASKNIRSPQIHKWIKTKNYCFHMWNQYIILSGAFTSKKSKTVLNASITIDNSIVQISIGYI